MVYRNIVNKIDYCIIIKFTSNPNPQFTKICPNQRKYYDSSPDNHSRNLQGNP